MIRFLPIYAYPSEEEIMLVVNILAGFVLLSFLLSMLNERPKFGE